MRHRQSILRGLTSTAVMVASALVVLAPANSASAVPAANDWLGIVNTYRAMSGLAAVSENSTWSSQAYSHGCYMLYNGIAHDEIPGRPG